MTLGAAPHIVNHVVQYQALDRTFSALADPTRREILGRLGQGPASISELAAPFGMSLTGMKKHVRILEEASLVITEKVGRARECRLGPEQLDDAVDWIAMYRSHWDKRFDGIEAYLASKKGERK